MYVFSCPDVCVHIILADSVFEDVHLTQQRSSLDEASK